MGKAVVIETNFVEGKVGSGTIKVQYINGDIYEGKMNQHEKREGMGKQYYRNGDKYEGEWINDQREGKGKIYFGDGGSFEGSFKDDEIYSGKLKDKYGNAFENDYNAGSYFLRGKLTGQGKANFINGDLYLGEFRDGVFSG